MLLVTPFILLTLPLVLHPCHKLVYFWNLKWSSDWIKLAETLMCNEFEHNYMAISEDKSDEDRDKDGMVASQTKEVSLVHFTKYIVTNCTPEICESI